MTARVSIVTLAVVAGCGFHGDYNGTEYQCGEGGSCPEGYMCVGQRCVIGGDAGGMPDALPGPDAMPTGLRCGTLSLLRDDFEDGAIDPQWWPFDDVGATNAETGGEYRVSLAAGSADAWAGIGSAEYFDLHEGALESGVVQVGGHDTVLEVRDWQGQKLQMVVEDGELLAIQLDSANDQVYGQTPYSATDHRYWRISSDAGGNLTFETSPDRSTWNTLATGTTQLDLDHVQGYLAAGGELASASTARFDVLNPQQPSVGFCAANTLQDSWTSPPFDPIWDHWSDDTSSCTIAESGGSLAMTFDGVSSNCFVGVQSRHRFDLTESSFTVDAGALPVHSSFISYMQVIVPHHDENHFEIGLDGTGLYFEEQVAGSNVAEDGATYDPTNDRYWRLEGHAGRLYVKTSPDGASWSTRLDAPADFDVSGVVLVLGAGNYDPLPGAVSGSWSNLNP